MLNLQPDDVAKKAFSVGVLSLITWVVLLIIALFMPVHEKYISAVFLFFLGSIAVHYFAHRNKNYFDDD